MIDYDLCLIWYWEYDSDFVANIQAACSVQNVTLWLVSTDNLVGATADLLENRVRFKVLLDRAQDHAGFHPFLQKARELAAYIVNPRERSHWAGGKATMHLEMITHGIETPYTIILAPFVEQPILPDIDLSPLGEKFVIKPAGGGGGEGVTMQATSLEQIMQARIEFAAQKYLVQAHIEPQELDGRKAWFRIYYVDGNIYPCWWDPETHIFAPIQTDEELRFGLSPLRLVTAKIASICLLDWFSTEIALTREGKFVAVDYVNDSIDLRIQAKAYDGVPDEIVRALAGDLVSLTARKCNDI